MGDAKREIERKYEATPETRLPDLTRVAGVSDVTHQGVMELDAVYYDTADLRLAAGSLTLRRRTGGSDEGWHLKLPVAPGIRDEIRAPLAETLPQSLAGLLRSRVRDADVLPVVRLLSARDVHHLVDADGTLLAELSVDEVVAERLAGPGRGTTAEWTEIEVELADDGDPAFLDAVEKRLRKAGVRPSASASKLATALTQTDPGPEIRPAKQPKSEREQQPKGEGEQQPKTDRKQQPKSEREQHPESDREQQPPTAGDHVLAYIRTQVEAVIAYDPAVRRDLPDSVHQMRVATRRLRSAFKTYRKILDRTVTDPLGDELKWLASELGVDRDQEVLDARFDARTADLPRTLLLGPVTSRLRLWSVARRTGTGRRILAVLDGERYLALLNSLDALLADPPLRPAAARTPQDALPRAVLKDYERLATRVGHALDQPPGEDRDLAMHEARKAAKRARYAGEAARPALGKPAKRFAKRMKAVQKVLGEHQDSVLARDALRDLAIQAHAAGETAFTWGLLYGQEQAAAAENERELPQVWASASAPELRAALKG